MLCKIVTDLEIYRLALKASIDISNDVKKISHFWTNEDASQILRSSSSVPSNIAEGFCQRFYPKQMVHYLFIALGSSDETQNHLSALHAKNYISDIQFHTFFRQYKNISIKILNFINHLKQKHQIVL